MDISEILSQAKKNQKQTTTVNRYNTNVKPAKKLTRTVNPTAIKAFLDKKRQDELKNSVEAKKKKEELQKLRDESKTTKKANSMAKRTKDNLKVYKGEDVLGLYPEPKKKRRRRSPSPHLSPEQERKYKNFIKHVVPKIKVSGVNDDESDDEYAEPVLEQDERKMRKLDKKKAKARSASNLEFSDLLQLAEKQKNKVQDSSSSEEESDCGESDGSTDKYGRPLTAEEKYQRERRKRRELEERLKMASSAKLPTSSGKSDSKPKSLANFKIGKLNSGLSEGDKKAKVKVLMDRFKKSSDGRASSTSMQKSSDKRNQGRSKPMQKSHSTTSLVRDKRTEKGINSKHKTNGVKDESSKRPLRSLEPPKSSTTSNSKTQFGKNGAISPHKAKLKPTRPSSDSEMRQTKIDGHLKPKKRGAEWDGKLSQTSRNRSPSVKLASNPYKHTVMKQSGTKRPSDTLVDPWAKTQKDPSKRPKPSTLPGKCTLSITSETVRTNCPDIAQEDPYLQQYKKTGKVLPKLTPEMVARYKAAMIRKLQAEGKIPPRNGRPIPPQKRRYGVIGDDSEDEYDSELEGFIVDEDEDIEEEQDVDVSSHIKQIFGYDKSKYGRESEWELSKMDASYKDIEKEEKRSLRIAREEDAREAKLEEERMKRMKKNRR